MVEKCKYDFIALVGPTGIGKSRVAFELAKKFKGNMDIVCMDSCQVYKGAIIGTDSPSSKDRGEVSFHLYNFLSPSVELSAGKYAELAVSTIKKIKKDGSFPMLVGGTGFFLSALTDGFHKLPDANNDIRMRVNRIVQGFGVERAYRLLKHLDPSSAEKVDMKNPLRVSRALEIIFQTNIRLSDIRKNKRVDYGLKGLVFGLYIPLKEIESRIEERTKNMIDMGFISEVRKLMEMGFSLKDPVFKSIGYEYIYYHLMGAMSLNEAVKLIIKDTKSYARRQLTWFSRDKRVWWLPIILDVEGINDDYISFCSDLLYEVLLRFLKF